MEVTNLPASPERQGLRTAISSFKAFPLKLFFGIAYEIRTPLQLRKGTPPPKEKKPEKTSSLFCRSSSLGSQRWYYLHAADLRAAVFFLDGILAQIDRRTP